MTLAFGARRRLWRPGADAALRRLLPTPPSSQNTTYPRPSGPHAPLRPSALPPHSLSLSCFLSMSLVIPSLIPLSFLLESLFQLLNISHNAPPSTHLQLPSTTQTPKLKPPLSPITTTKPCLHTAYLTPPHNDQLKPWRESLAGNSS